MAFADFDESILRETIKRDTKPIVGCISGWQHSYHLDYREGMTNNVHHCSVCGQSQPCMCLGNCVFGVR